MQSGDRKEVNRILCEKFGVTREVVRKAIKEGRRREKSWKRKKRRQDCNS